MQMKTKTLAIKKKILAVEKEIFTFMKINFKSWNEN